MSRTPVLGTAPIASPDNAKLRLVRGLHRRGVRAREGCLLAEGPRLVGDALEAGAAIRFALVRDGTDDAARLASLLSRLAAAAIPIHPVERSLFDAAAATETPQGILAVIETPTLPLPGPADPNFTSPWLALDGLQDPGNLGTALRSAAAAGAGAVLLTPGTVDATNPKAVRAGMGAHFRIPVRHLDWESLADLVRERAVFLADAEGDLIYTDIDWTQPALVVVGGEARGPSTAHWTDLGARTLRIPMAGSVESLNAGAAAAVILFEAARGRLARP